MAEEINFPSSLSCSFSVYAMYPFYAASLGMIAVNRALHCDFHCDWNDSNDSIDLNFHVFHYVHWRLPIWNPVFQAISYWIWWNSSARDSTYYLWDAVMSLYFELPEVEWVQPNVTAMFVTPNGIRSFVAVSLDSLVVWLDGHRVPNIQYVDTGYCPKTTPNVDGVVVVIPLATFGTLDVGVVAVARNN